MRRMCVLLVLILSCVALAPSSQAGTKSSGFFTYVTSTVGASDMGLVVVGAACPANTQVVGAGGKGVEPSKSFTLTGSNLDDFNNGSSARASWDLSVGRQKLKAVAVCIDVGTLASMEYAVIQQNLDSTTGTASVPCPMGFAAFGGGGAVSGANARLTSTGIGNDVSSWSSTGSNTSPAFVDASVVCTNDSLFVGEIPEKSAEVGVNDTKSVVAKCTGGKKVASGGFESGAADVLATVPWDGKDGDTAPDDGWKTTFRNRDDAPAAVTTSAFCLGEL